jgi:putative membrane protein
MTHVCTPAWVSAVLATAVMTAGCDRQTVPLPERKTAPAVERRDTSPAQGTRAPASPGERAPAVPPDTPTGQSIEGDGAASAPSKKSSLSTSDQAFVTAAAGAGLYDLEGGRLAATKGKSPAVRAFGTMLATQRQAAHSELQSLANSRGVALPPRVPAEQRDKLERLSALNGSEFDRAFVQTVGVDDHQAAIEQFASAARDADDPQLRQWIQQTLPALQHQLREAKELVDVH